ncbi:MAG TPA: hypothetical protein RMH85_26220 [Polyangiaceae bacterium LLY-WYZ-15_(1-7)]|nr:hypothetical protein [Polyangiaceae bacterium LLY-WYZ-15_(1-7)]HJL04772.1 hypothetical protein [Polyangiaceae bacterium LLY-WYZ-15_(1-7)]HJL11999.1 hypothetical protein [Polyangiaceae bacterium LLY-WYZ-15_(1-7)]HJL26756.1 hypothetical protein [Polyangiaceae bacterium LLY-WYZ-15_(1-7)]HJL38556.1 hypothetical protein [Polyangiaceae bacterium LLY-WYZ-15_(1-7)]
MERHANPLVQTLDRMLQKAGRPAPLPAPPPPPHSGSPDDPGKRDADERRRREAP